MNDYWLSFVLGVIEGLTEFLPVSSTAHLRIAQAVFGLSLQDEYWKMFSIVIQLGAILSVLVFFRKRIVDFTRAFFSSSKKMQHPVSYVMIAFVVTAIPAFLLSKVIGKNLESLNVIGGSLLVGGVVMWIVDVVFKTPQTQAVETMTLKQSIGIGIFQIFSAVFPGTSRSMSTIAGGQILGMSRPAALEFSFFVSIPTMMAATGYDLLKTVVLHRDGPPIIMDTHRWAVLAVGFVVSFIVALGVIAWFMAWVRKRGFIPFALYRIALGLAVLFWVTRISSPQI